MSVTGTGLSCVISAAHQLRGFGVDVDTFLDDKLRVSGRRDHDYVS